MTRSLRAVAIALACALVGVGWFYSKERQAALETQRQLDRANQALAESINNELGLSDQLSELKARQRGALWKLAVVDEPVKRNFVSILARNPGETIRDSPGFGQIFRALGLLRPSVRGGRRLNLRDRECTSNDRGPKGCRLLAGRTQGARVEADSAQASQTLDSVLKQIGQTTDPNALLALTWRSRLWRSADPRRRRAHALKPISGRLIHGRSKCFFRPSRAWRQAARTQATQTFAAVLTEIGQSSDRYVLFKELQALTPS